MQVTPYAIFIACAGLYLGTVYGQDVNDAINSAKRIWPQYRLPFGAVALVIEARPEEE